MPKIKSSGWVVSLALPKNNRLIHDKGWIAVTKSILGDLNVPKGINEVSILITNDKQIQKLNLNFRGKNKPTDVLSFPMGAAGILGDIVISLNTAKRQAREYDVNLYQELLRLLIHGLLHLCGYDHENVPKRKAEKMRRTEERLYRKYLAKGRRMVLSRPK